MIEKTWVERPGDALVVAALQAELAISNLLAKLLANRGIVDVKSAHHFLRPMLKNLTEPTLFKDMDKAVARIVKAIDHGDVIGIFGDYDVDGVCATALLQEFLVSISANVVVTLPHRMTEGYGLSRAGIERLKSHHATLLIAADCGTSAHDEILHAKSLGFDVIVVDHHNVSSTLPEALSVINPKRVDCASQASYLCATGVAFFLILAVRRHLREQGFFKTTEPDVRKLLDLVALATVCDVVPLIEDNRCLVKAGLGVLKEGGRPGFLALLNACGIDKEKLSSTNLGFHLGPRINAAGRLDDALDALRLLQCGDYEQAKIHASELEDTNRERRAIEEETVEEACRMIEADREREQALAWVLFKEKWHPGVVGIVASRIAERFHRPAIIIGQRGKGSGRSIKGIDLHHMVSRACGSLEGFGGHAHAIGVTLGPLGVDVFRNDVLKVLREEVPAQIFNKEIAYDAEISMKDISLSLIDEIASLEPFGAHNPYPVVRINRCFMRNLRRLNQGHLKGELENSDGFISFIGFRMDIDNECARFPLDVLGVLEKNEWQGRISPQLRLIDYKKSGGDSSYRAIPNSQTSSRI